MIARPFTSAEQIRQDIGQQISAGTQQYQTYGQAQFQTRPELLRADMMTSLATQMQQARKAGLTGPAVELTEQEQTGLKEAIGVGEDTITQNIEATRNLQTEITGLQESINSLQRTMNGLREVSDAERTARGFRTREQSEQQMNDLVMQKARASEQLDAMTTSTGMAAERMGVLRGAMPMGGMRRFAGRAMGVTAGLAPLMMVGGQLPGAFRRAEAAQAAMGNFEARAALGGDVERMMAAEQLGGIESIQGAAGLEAGLGIGGNIVGAAGAAAGAALVPGMQGIGAVGAGYFGMQAIRGVADFRSAQRQAQESIISAEMERQAELFQFTRAGRGVGVGAFQQAVGMGGAELTPFMLGNQANIPAMAGGVPTGRMQTLRQFAAGMGVGNRFQETMGQLAGGMGGVFMQEQGARLGQMPDIAANALQLQAAGLGGAPGLMGQLFQGARPNDAQGRREASETLRSTFEDAVASGLDKARAGQALQFMAAQAQAGLGAAGAAEIGFRQQLGVAQQMFGAAGIEGAEMGFVQRGMTNIQEATRGGGGMAGLAGFAAAENVNREFFGGKLSPADIANLQQSMNDPAGLEALAAEYGVDVNGEEVSQAMQQGRVTEAGRIARIAMPGMRGAERLAVGQMAGARTMTERVAAGQFGGAITRAGVARGEGAPIPGQFPDVYGPMPAPTVAAMAAAAPAIGGAAGALAVGMQQIDATKIVSGLETLGNQQLPALNKALSDLIDRAEKVLAGEIKPPTHLQVFGDIMSGRSFDPGQVSAPLKE
jgi:hypothetical protein